MGTRKKPVLRLSCGGSKRERGDRPMEGGQKGESKWGRSPVRSCLGSVGTGREQARAPAKRPAARCASLFGAGILWQERKIPEFTLL